MSSFNHFSGGPRGGPIFSYLDKHKQLAGLAEETIMTGNPLLNKAIGLAASSARYGIELKDGKFVKVFKLTGMPEELLDMIFDLLGQDAKALAGVRCTCKQFYRLVNVAFHRLCLTDLLVFPKLKVFKRLAWTAHNNALARGIKSITIPYDNEKFAPIQALGAGCRVDGGHDLLATALRGLRVLGVQITLTIVVKKQPKCKDTSIVAVMYDILNYINNISSVSAGPRVRTLVLEFDDRESSTLPIMTAQHDDYFDRFDALWGPLLANNTFGELLITFTTQKSKPWYQRTRISMLNVDLRLNITFWRLQLWHCEVLGCADAFSQTSDLAIRDSHVTFNLLGDLLSNPLVQNVFLCDLRYSIVERDFGTDTAPAAITSISWAPWAEVLDRLSGSHPFWNYDSQLLRLKIWRLLDPAGAVQFAQFWSVEATETKFANGLLAEQIR